MNIAIKVAVVMVIICLCGYWYLEYILPFQDQTIIPSQDIVTFDGPITVEGGALESGVWWEVNVQHTNDSRILIGQIIEVTFLDMDPRGYIEPNLKVNDFVEVKGTYRLLGAMPYVNLNGEGLYIKTG